MKYFLWILGIICFIILSLPALAQSDTPTPESMNTTTMKINPSAVFGQDHAYTVTLRGNGEAIINARISFSNFEDGDKSTLQLRVPQGEPQDIVAYQVMRKPRCIQYADVRYDKPIGGDYSIENVPCLEYQEPNYYDYWWEKTQYLKVETLLDGDTITITLPKPVLSNSSGSIVLYYRSLGIVKKAFFGSFNYKFDTLKVKDPIRNLTVGITTDQEMVLKGAASQVQYRFDYAMPMIQSVGYSNKSTVVSTEFDNYVGQIGQGIIVKTASYLQPLDSFVVRGSYAKSTLRLYAGDIFKGASIVLGIFVILVGSIIYFMKRRKHSSENTLTQKLESSNGMSKATITAMMLLVSFVSSLISVGYTGLLYAVTQLLQQWMYSSNSIFIVLLLLIFSLVIYISVVGGPAIFMGIKKGIWWGVGTFLLTLFWLMTFLIVAIVFMMLSQSGSGGIYPQPILHKSDMMNKTEILPQSAN